MKNKLLEAVLTLLDVVSKIATVIWRGVILAAIILGLTGAIFHPAWLPLPKDGVFWFYWFVFMWGASQAELHNVKRELEEKNQLALDLLRLYK